MSKTSKYSGTQRLGGTFAGIIRDRQWDYKFDQHRIFPRWQSLVDPDTAAHSRPLKVVKDVLVLEVDNSAWMQQLRFQKLHLLELLNSQLGIARFSDIRFTLRGKEPEQQGRPAATVRFEPPPADQVAAFKEQIEIIEDEASRESLLRLWYLAHACRRD
jgi:predicted nucleic acid-binding Zn ribbon protein